MEVSLSLGPIVTNTDPAHLPGPEPLTGRYVKLERYTKDHFPDIWEHVGSHPDIWTCWPDGPFKNQPEFDEYQEKLTHISDDVVVYAVLPLSGPKKGRALGLAFGLSEEGESNRISELGMFFGPELQRTREGTEAAYLLADHLFKLNHRRLQWKTNALNVQSRKAAERYGFAYEGTFRQHQINKGRNRDSAWYSIIDCEWPMCSKAFELWLDQSNFDEHQRQIKRIEEIRESLSKVDEFSIVPSVTGTAIG